jgi:hypothetical protein
MLTTTKAPASYRTMLGHGQRRMASAAVEGGLPRRVALKWGAYENDFWTRRVARESIYG